MGRGMELPHGPAFEAACEMLGILYPFNTATGDSPKVFTDINQHDPDFIDSNRISIFDNNPIGNYRSKQQSRILLADARTSEAPTVLYAGTESNSKPFYTDRMGKHQWLENDHILITDSAGGRGIEVDQNGTIVWEYLNLINGNKLGSVWQIDRLPEWSEDIFQQ